MTPEDLISLCAECSKKHNLATPLNPEQYTYLCGQSIEIGRQRIEAAAKIIRESEKAHYKQLENICDRI